VHQTYIVKLDNLFALKSL